MPSPVGGAGDLGGVLSVVSITPRDLAAGVERDQPVEVSFSAALDAKTVNREAFYVLGPGGRVSGEVSVNGDRATFTPDAPWVLLADYSIELSSSIAGADGSSIDEAHRYSFRTRDGVFGKPKRLHTANVEFDIAANRAGYVALHWRTNASPRNAEAIIYDPTTRQWGPVTSLGTNNLNDYDYPCLGFNERGDAFAAVHGASGLEWRRYTAGHWSSSKTVSGRARASCALADDGTALVTWEETVGSDLTAFAASLSPQNSWSSTMTLQTKASARGVWRLGSGFVTVVQPVGNGGTYSRSFDLKAGLGESKLIATDTLNVIRVATFDETALIDWTSDDRIQVAVFDGDVWGTTDLGPGTAPTGASAGPTGHLATWHYQDNEYAARYDSGTGWQDPVMLGATKALPFTQAASIDMVGNALAVWPHGASIIWRRSVHGSDVWEDPQQIEDQEPTLLYAKVDGAGNVMVVWSNPLGLWASRFE